MTPQHKAQLEKNMRELEESGISRKEIYFFVVSRYRKESNEQKKKKKYTLKDFQKLRGYFDGDPNVSKNIDFIAYNT